MAIAIDPSLAATRPRAVKVITGDGPQRGQTVAEGSGDVQVVTEVDIPAFFRLFWGLLGV
jgi:inosine-uridine nucleoside N-ribohydrolase